ncbi:MAG: right-handed parallel beta-helix repeat-containing protein, partial [Nitrospira sp.]|nr:right-handed parallel beta-helix repeat-containing protein [Nitrospira sp.]
MSPGSGIAIIGSAVQGTLDRNRIESNVNSGIFIGTGANLTIANSLIVNHTGVSGIDINSSGPGTITVVNDTITGNGIGAAITSGVVSIVNTIVFGNGTDINGAFSGSNNIVAPTDPLFVPADLDFNLQPDSPARDGGDSTLVVGPFDFDGDTRILGINVDIGAQEIFPPVISSVVPDQGVQGTTLDVDINGTDFRDGVIVNFGADITINSVVVTFDTLIEVNMTIDPAAILGFRDVTVTDPDTQSGTLANGFEVLPLISPPSVVSVSPDEGFQGAPSLPVVINGTDFQPGATVSFGVGITVNSTLVASATQINANITIAAAAIPGFRDVTVTNPDLQSDTLPNGFEVLLAPPPNIAAVVPAQGVQGTASLLVAITGSDFQNGAMVSLEAGITVNSVTFVSNTALGVNITIDATATPGFRVVTVTNPDTQSDTLNNGFEVLSLPIPIVISVSPNQGTQGTPSLLVAINGENFQDGATVSFGEGITVNTTLVVSDILITVDIAIDLAAPIGFRDVTVTNPDALSGSLANAFEVQAFPCVLPFPPPRPRQAFRSLPGAP